MSAWGSNRLNRGPQAAAGPTGYLGNGYDYGNPAGATDNDGGGTVVAQWTFEEASGNVIDSVGGISVPATGTIPRSMITPQFKLLSVGASTDSGRFASTTDHAALAPGTSDFVIECTVVLNCWATASEQYIIDTRESVGVSGFAVSFDSAGEILFYLNATDGTTSSAFWGTVFTANTLPTDGIIKIRIYVNRTPNPATAIAVYNGTTLASKNMTGITPAKSIGATAINLGGRYDANRNLFGIMKEVRLTTGTLTANSGGPGGG